MPAIEPLCEEETAVLERVPFCVFFLVAGADGKVDQQELEQFANGLLELSTSPALGGPEAPACLLVGNSSRYFEALQAEVKAFVASGGRAAALGRIEQGMKILDARLSAAMALGYKRGLYRLGEVIAEASGGVLGVGRVSRAEKEALVALGAVLDLPG